MNGQMYQICSIVAAARRALKNRSSICYIPADYENPSQFLCLTGSGGLPYTAHDVSQWYEHLKEQHLTDIQLYCPTSVRDRSLLGFSNTTQASIVCFFKGNRMTYFIADWKFDSKERKWNVLYTNIHGMTRRKHGHVLKITRKRSEVSCTIFRTWRTGLDLKVLQTSFIKQERFWTAARNIPIKHMAFHCRHYRTITCVCLRQPAERMYLERWDHGMIRLRGQRTKKDWSRSMKHCLRNC